MTEIDVLKYDLAQERKAFDKLHKQYIQLIHKQSELEKENELLVKEKERYKRLSEIRQQQIDNRILTIKEFINNCSDNKVRSTLKELFYSEVNEYDLSSKYRELLGENEQLKSKNRGLQSELQIFKEDVTHSNLQINKLADENEQLKLISNHRGEMVSFATSLIQDMGSEEMLKMWNDFTEVMYQKWKKKRGIK